MPPIERDGDLNGGNTALGSIVDGIATVVHRIVQVAFEWLRTFENVDRTESETDVDPELVIAGRAVDFPLTESTGRRVSKHRPDWQPCGRSAPSS